MIKRADLHADGPPRPRVAPWIGDALRAVRALDVTDPAEIEAICALILGAPAARPVAPAAPIARASVMDEVPRAATRPAATPAPAVELSPSDRVEVLSQVVELARQLPDAAQRGASPALAVDPGTAWRGVPRPLFRAPVERSILREIAAIELPSSVLDVDRLVEILGDVALPRTLPYLPESTTRRGVQLLVDRSSRLDGFAADVDRLESRLVTLLNQGRVEILRFRELPSLAGPDGADSWTPYRSPAPFVPIVVVTAFARSSARAWQPFVERWAREQREVTFLVPHGTGRVPRTIAAVARVVVWDAPTTARSVRRPAPSRADLDLAPSRQRDPLARLVQRSPLAARLARYASLASYLEPALLRALRDGLLPGEVTPAVELDLWASDLTTAKTREGFVFTPRALERLRRELEDEATTPDGAQLVTKAAAIIRAVHANAPPLLRLEEHLTALSLGVADPAATASIEDAIEPVIEAMERSPSRAKNLAHWFARTSARLPRAVLDSDAARLLGFVARTLVPGASSMESLPSDAALQRAAAILPRRDEVKIALRWLGPEERRVLEIVRLADTQHVDDRWNVIHATGSDPLVLWVGDAPIVVGVTPILVKLSGEIARVTPLRDLVGKRWEIVPRDEHGHAIATVWGTKTLAYLIDEALCMTSIDRSMSDDVRLDFPWGSVNGKVIGKERDSTTLAESALGWALIRLDAPVTPAPLLLGADAGPDDEWEIAIRASKRLRGRGLLDTSLEHAQLLAHSLVEPVSYTELEGAPVFVRGRVAGHVGSVNRSAGEPTRIVVCPSSVVREAWADSRVTPTAGIDHRLATLQVDHPTLQSSWASFAVGRRTFLLGPWAEGITTLKPRRAPPLQANLLRFGESTMVVVTIAPMASRRSIRDLWAGRERRPAPPEARVATPAVAFGSTGVATFVCVPGDAEGFRLHPFPIEALDSSHVEIVEDEGGPLRLRGGLPVFQRGSLIGLTLERTETGRFPLRPIEQIAFDLAFDVLTPRDWSRVARRIAGEAAEALAGAPIVQETSASDSDPRFIASVVLESRSQPILQFVLDQSVRRLEAREPEREPGPCLLAELVLDAAGRPRTDAFSGQIHHTVRFSVAGLPRGGAYSQAIYTLDDPSFEGRTRIVRDSGGRFLLELALYGDFEIGIELPGEPTITLRARLCELLDEGCLTEVRGDLVAIEDAIDTLRRN